MNRSKERFFISGLFVPPVRDCPLDSAGDVCEFRRVPAMLREARLLAARAIWRVGAFGV